MLRAEQAALEQHGKAELLRILDREFEYYKQAYDSVGTQAALIAGFTVTVIVTLDTASTPHELHEWIPTVYHVCAFVALCALIYSVMAVTTIVVWGPGLALRGSDPNSMHRAVDGIKAARFEIYSSFFLGVVAFILMSVTVAWVQMDKYIASACTVLAGFTLICILVNGVRTKAFFNVPLQSSDGLTYERVSAASSVSSADSHASGVRSAGWAAAATSEPLLPPGPTSGGDELVGADARHSGCTARHNGGHSLSTFRRLAPAAAPPAGAAGAGDSWTRDGGGSGAQQQQQQQQQQQEKKQGAPPTKEVGSCGGGGGSCGSGFPATGRGSLNRMSDELATKLLVEGGGWLWKKDKRYGAGWKKRWVSVRHDSLFYSKVQQPPLRQQGQAASSSSSPAAAAASPSPDEKRISLARMEMHVGEDGLTIRLMTTQNSAGASTPRDASDDLLSPSSSTHSATSGFTLSSSSFRRQPSRDRSSGGPDVVDFKCDVAEERGAWVAYFKAGIAIAMGKERR